MIRLGFYLDLIDEVVGRQFLYHDTDEIRFRGIMAVGELGSKDPSWITFTRTKHGSQSTETLARFVYDYDTVARYFRVNPYTGVRPLKEEKIWGPLPLTPRAGLVAIQIKPILADTMQSLAHPLMQVISF